MINNPKPIRAKAFTGLWITHLSIAFPTTDKPKGFIGGQLAPYNGEHLLATGGRRLFIGDVAAKRADDTTLDATLADLDTECQRQANKTMAVTHLSVTAPDPARPVMAQVSFADGTFHRIPDCFALAASDTTFAAVLMATMAEMARQAGLTVKG